ncbi:DUF1178 family protein [Sphingosinicella sp. YJ22]|uniref:DUF1178 family protein n=1 Tax=Sphingosinicella sp. YJ22 TaxID=1104780 RepID=UPI00140AEB22|nr:DUF1178 family protein [Sphingosinicella sp. YJ22]
MIVFDLRCASAGHVFEAWFGSTDDYESQKERGLVACPICGDPDVAKAPMAPAVPKKGGSVAPATDMMSAPPAAVKEMLGKMAAFQREMLEKSEWVGDRFATEARAMHVGDIDSRPIHGQTTPDQAASLAEDGVPVAPLLFPVAPPGEEN